MSIDDLLLARIKEKQLHILRPNARGTSPQRLMLLHENLWNFLESDGPDDEWEVRKGYLQADLELFADGSPVGPKYLFLLSPAREAVWEIRSLRPMPSVRVLGRFVHKDVFVATNFALRDELEGWKSRAWRDARLGARTIWTRLFHNYEPLRSTNVHDVVSGAIDGTYFKGD
jgi:hypothetical protein